MNNAVDELTGSRLTSASAVSIVNAVVSVGFSVATVAQGDGGAAWYGADRAVALLGVAIAAAATRRPLAVVLTGWTLAAVQFLDGFIGLAAGDVATGVGPLVLGVVTAIATIRLQRTGSH